MCGRFNLLSENDAQEMEQIIDEINRRYKGKPELQAMAKREVFPTNIVPVLANSKQLVPQPYLMKWGFTPHDRKGAIINARSETASTLPMFKKSMFERRCIVPASNYFEWEHRGKNKIQYALKTNGQNIIYMAGLYRHEEDTPLPVFTILTREAAHDIAFIHNRMPVILAPDTLEQWLQPGADVEGIIRHAQEQIEYVAI